jgi:acetyltransferase-like isoleucine patch superfamily enzyme
MNPLRHLTVLLRGLKKTAIKRILAHRIQVSHPSLDADPTAIWDYGYSDLDAIEIGNGVSVRAFAEILVFKRTKHSSIEGRLILGDRVVISTGVNVRAAGGTIRIGAGTAISQNSVIVAANHGVRAGIPYLNTTWDETRTGIDIGANVWVGAGCVILPGTTIGDNSLIAAGSVVNGSVPANEVWGGTPARKIKSLVPDRAAV